MKPLILTLVFCIIPFTNMFSKDLIAVRRLFYAASQNNAKTDSLLRYIDHMEDVKSPISRGYRGMYYMLKARYSYNPVSKLSSFSKGRKLLEGAITSDPANVELRFLRLSVQLNAPSFLDYNDDIEQDKKTIVSLYRGVTDDDLRARILNFMTSINIHLR